MCVHGLHGLSGKIFAVLRAFPPNEPTRKRLVNEAVAWAARHGEYEHGDPELHDVAGKLYAESKDRRAQLAHT